MVLSVLLLLAHAAAVPDPMPGIDCPASVDAYRLVRARAVGVPKGAAVLWRVTPRTVDRATTAADRCEFAAAPGVYEVTLLVVGRDGDGVTLMEFSQTVTVRGSAVTPPPVTPPPAGGKNDPKAALHRIQFGNAGCTCTVIEPRRADGRYDCLTAAHCTKRVGDRGRMYLADGSSVPVTVTARDAAADLCWLVTDSDPGELAAARLAASLPPRGSAVWQAGFGMTQPGTRKDGVYLGEAAPGGKLSYRILVDHGDSGGGIFRKDTGELLSPVCCSDDPGQSVTVFGGSCLAAAALRPVPRVDWSPLPMPGPADHGPAVPAGWHAEPMPALVPVKK